MSAADPAAHFHALLQFRGGAAAWPTAAPAAAGGSCRPGTGLAHGRRETAQDTGCTAAISPNWNLFEDRGDFMLCFMTLCRQSLILHIVEQLL